MVSLSAKVSVVPSVIPEILNRLVGSIRCCGVIFVFLNKDMSEPESKFVIASRHLIKFVGPRFTEYIETGSVGNLKNYSEGFVAYDMALADL